VARSPREADAALVAVTAVRRSRIFNLFLARRQIRDLGPMLFARLLEPRPADVDAIAIPVQPNPDRPACGVVSGPALRASSSACVAV